MNFYVRGIIMGLKSVVPVLTLALLALVLPGGTGLAQTQVGSDIYAAADLVPSGAQPDAEGSNSTATFEHTATGGTRVTAVVMGLKPNNQYTSHIHDGSCSGATLYPLTTLNTDAAGAARAATELSAQVEFGRWYVDVHADGQETEPALCGDVVPALAGAPVPLPGTAPGMPGTGQPSGLLLVGTLAACLALLSILLGRYLTSVRGKGN